VEWRKIETNQPLPSFTHHHIGNDYLVKETLMYTSRIVLRSRAIRMTAPAIQRPLVRTITTVGPRAASDPARPTTTNPDAQGPQKGGNRNALYIGGGLVGAGAIWYYYAMSESARIAKEQEGPGPLQKATAGVEGGRTRSIEDTIRPDKERAQEFIRSGDAKYQDVKAEAQAKVQAGRDQLGQGVERGKQRFEEGLDQAARRAAEAQSTVGE
jgi:hypothetical protein